jgi:hypothetical protein
MFFVAEIGMEVVSLFTDYTLQSQASSGDFSGHSQHATISMHSFRSRYTYVDLPFWSPVIPTETHKVNIVRSQGWRAQRWQLLAVLICVALGLCMVLNNQMGGEGMWFWYADLFHHGVKLYSVLHTPLQPDFVLLNSAWMSVVGRKTVLTQVPSLFFILALCASLYLVLRESDWPDWQRAIMLVGAFALNVSGHSYRFDDYHVMAECCILFALLMLLWIARAESVREQLLWTAVLGVLCGITLTTRLPDGVAALAAASCCLPFLIRSRRLLAVLVLLASAFALALLLVSCTGDSLSAYLSNSVFKAAASKGGTGSLAAAPFLLLRNALLFLRISGKWLLVWLAAVIALGAVAYRYLKLPARFVVLLQLAFATLSFLLSSPELRGLLLRGVLLRPVLLVLIVATYLVTPLVAIRAGWLKVRGLPLDARECLVLLPFAVWGSYAAGAGAEPLTNYYGPIVMLLVMFPVLVSFQKLVVWVNASFVTLMVLLGLSAISSKYLLPYSWQNYSYSPMFQHREWYRHPVYGPLYIDSDLLHFSEAICKDIQGGGPGSELLSLPYPYPNYFCDTPPWHGYVQTFFDTSTRSSIEQMMRDLDTAPPQWIVYQRQIHILDGAERLYNHGQPIAQRDLDTMILQKIASGAWRLVDKRDYLEGDGWYVIQTRP